MNLTGWFTLSIVWVFHTRTINNMVREMTDQDFLCVGGVKLGAVDLLRIVRPAEVARIGGVSRMSVYRMTKDGRLPPPLRLGAGTVGWPLAQVLQAFGLVAAEGLE